MTDSHRRPTWLNADIARKKVGASPSLSAVKQGPDGLTANPHRLLLKRPLDDYLSAY